MTVKIEIDAPNLPEGWEYTNEYRAPKEKEHYVGCMENIGTCSFGFEEHNRKFIVRKIKPEIWRANEGGSYWRLYLSICTDTRCSGVNREYEKGNYFQYLAKGEKAMELGIERFHKITEADDENSTKDPG